MTKEEKQRKCGAPCEEPLRLFCRVLSKGEEGDEDLCNDIVDESETPVQELKDMFGDELIDEELGTFKTFLEQELHDKKKAKSLLKRMRLSTE